MDRVTKRKILKGVFYVLVALWGLKAGYHIGRVCELDTWGRWGVGCLVMLAGVGLFRAITTPADDRDRNDVGADDPGGRA